MPIVEDEERFSVVTTRRRSLFVGATARTNVKEQQRGKKRTREIAKSSRSRGGGEWYRGSRYAGKYRWRTSNGGGGGDGDGGGGSSSNGGGGDDDGGDEGDGKRWWWFDGRWRRWRKGGSSGRGKGGECNWCS
ncbi:uncharacterized protein LOC128894841 [Hylaeus anthracinus]|uniref:uncharacterized protein LOC128894841 n=1 Tax=Hylaeus anthracinus TaxID=313031 RepID=UPI0023B93B01|nr:uncharacterized protein LOC128894841 [Hylaeus anthracinus]